MSDAAFEYYTLLGGHADKYDKETTRRVNDFSNEFTVKRDYRRFTLFDATNDDMIVGKHLRLFSFCEHHLLPYFGEVAIGYIPSSKIMGLSKFQRLVDACASKPSIQESLTHEIAQAINGLLHPRGVAVAVKAIHSCVFARGVQSTNAEFETLAMMGVFRTELQPRSEFLASLARAKWSM